MSSQLDIALDEVIKTNRRENNGAQRKGGRGNQRGGRGEPYNKADSAYNELKGVDKVMVSNLHFNVTEQDLRELFAQIGKIRSSKLNFDANGKSQGTGEIIFFKAADAETAVQKYNGVTLDGRKMHLALPYTPSTAKVPISSRVGASRDVPNNRNRSGRGGQRRRDFRGKKSNRSQKTKEELDQELDDFFKKPVEATETKEN